jgi:hypothetical protein
MSIEVLGYVASGCVATHAVWGAQARWAKRPRQPQRALDVSDAALLDECERAKKAEVRYRTALVECAICAGATSTGDEPIERYAVLMVNELAVEYRAIGGTFPPENKPKYRTVDGRLEVWNDLYWEPVER